MVQEYRVKDLITFELDCPDWLVELGKQGRVDIAYKFITQEFMGLMVNANQEVEDIYEGINKYVRSTGPQIAVPGEIVCYDEASDEIWVSNWRRAMEGSM